jgi:hypothetical protein
VQTVEGRALVCNNQRPKISGLIACGPRLKDPLLSLLESSGLPKLA